MDAKRYFKEIMGAAIVYIVFSIVVSIAVYLGGYATAIQAAKAGLVVIALILVIAVTLFGLLIVFD